MTVQNSYLTTLLMLSVGGLPYAAIADSRDYTLDGRFVSVTTSESSVLELTFHNRSSRAACVESWTESRSSPVEIMYRDEFIVRNERGDAVPYASRIGDYDPRDHNTSVFIVPKDEKIVSRYDLAKLYRLTPGKYTVSILLSAVDCRGYDDQWISPPASNNMKYLSVEKGTDVNAMSELFSRRPGWSKYGRILELAPVSFTVREVK